MIQTMTIGVPFSETSVEGGTKWRWRETTVSRGNSIVRATTLEGGSAIEQ